MVDLGPAPIALKRAPGNQRIGDTFTPKCIFTLHIGTVVLSDEAVLNSRDMSLVLTWKFYDQNYAMTRMRAGRVVLFDFSTQYDVRITDDFLRYMKQEEMPIIICELDKQDEPFASCALPLRDALLHTNRRADMSLALVAGPQLRLARGATDPLDGGDEVGVLDLWCMLRAEPRLLPAINRAIARPDPPKNKSSSAHNMSMRSASRILEQILDEDHSNDRLSQDLELNVGQMQRRSGPDRGVSSSWNTRNVSIESRADRLEKENDTLSVVPAYDYYDRNVQASNLYGSSKSHTGEDGGSQAPSSAASLVPKLQGETDMQKEKRKRSSRFSFLSGKGKKTSSDVRGTPRSSRFIQNDGEQEISRCDTSKIIGSCRMQDNSKKSVTINHKYCEAVTTEVPQKDVPEEPCHNQIDITILWLALNEECEAMMNPKIQRLYVAYSFLGRCGAELETPVSLPKPKHYVEKCYFNFKKSFQLHDCDLPLLGHMARCRSAYRYPVSSKDCIIFSVVSEPPEDPLGLDSCEDVGSGSNPFSHFSIKFKEE